MPDDEYFRLRDELDRDLRGEWAQLRRREAEIERAAKADAPDRHDTRLLKVVALVLLREWNYQRLVHLGPE
jgi:hypothetical protein